MKDVALMVLGEFEENGLYTAMKQNNGSWKIGKSKITKEQYDALKSRLNKLEITVKLLKKQVQEIIVLNPLFNLRHFKKPC